MTIRNTALWRAARKNYSFCKRQLLWVVKYLTTPGDELVHFRCNVCGVRTRFPRKDMGREQWSCRSCASTVRWRSVIHALSVELFGKSLAIAEFPYRPDLVGVGLSDWEGYANRLVKKIGYTNTFYHQEPLLDITCIDSMQHGQYDFLISSDVFEHICPPISDAFQNAYKLLKPGGVMILTIPYVEGETREHFPEVRKFTVAQEGSTWTLHGITADGGPQRFTDLTFHGGPGTVLEFRLFGKTSIEQESRNSGFDPVRIHGEAAMEFGIVWNRYIPEEAPYRPLIYGLDTPPWVLVKARSKESGIEP